MVLQIANEKEYLTVGHFVIQDLGSSYQELSTKYYLLVHKKLPQAIIEVNTFKKSSTSKVYKNCLESVTYDTLCSLLNF